MEYKETTFYQSHLLGVDEYVDGKHKVRDVTIRDLLNEMGLIDQIDLDKYKENVNYFFVESEDLYFYLKKQNINNIIRFSSKYDIQKYEEIFKELIEKAD